MVEQIRNVNVKFRRQQHVFYVSHKSDSKSDSNNNNSNSSSYSPELPKIEEEIRELCIDKILDNHHELRETYDAIDQEKVSHDKNLENTIDDISTSSQFSSISEESFKYAVPKTSPNSSLLKESSQSSSDSSPRTPKSNRRYHQNAKRQLFTEQTPVKKVKCPTEKSSPGTDITRQFKQNMKRLKEEAFNNKKEPMTCLKNTIQYQMSKSTIQVSRKELRFGGKRSCRFQSYTPENELDENPQSVSRSPCSSSTEFHCKSCGMKFRYLCNLTSHFVIVHNLVRDEDHDIQCIATKSRQNSPLKKEPHIENTSHNQLPDDDEKTKTIDGTTKYYQQFLYGKKQKFHFCEICEKFFKFGVNLQTHKRTVHSL